MPDPNTRIYYFSGTGNCLIVARRLAKLVNGVVVAIRQELLNKPMVEAPHVIGIVFPAYLVPLSGVPLIVERFVRSIPAIGSRRLFLVCTCGGYESVNAIPTLWNLARMVRSLGGQVTGQYSLRMPMNNLDYDHIPVPIERDSSVILARSEKRIQDIADRILKGKRARGHIAYGVINLLLKPMNAALRGACVAALRRYAHEPEDSTRAFRELIPLTDRSIVISDQCTGCGTCVKVCPVNNIRIIERRPHWNGNCEMCFACDEWCPREAVRHWSRANGVKYHHPAVGIRDFVSNNVHS